VGGSISVVVISTFNENLGGGKSKLMSKSMMNKTSKPQIKTGPFEESLENFPPNVHYNHRPH